MKRARRVYYPPPSELTTLRNPLIKKAHEYFVHLVEAFDYFLPRCEEVIDKRHAGRFLAAHEESSREDR